MADKKKVEVEVIVSEPSEAEKQFVGIPVPEGPGIDERMADLQKDLVAMGAREPEKK